MKFNAIARLLVFAEMQSRIMVLYTKFAEQISRKYKSDTGKVKDGKVLFRYLSSLDPTAKKVYLQWIITRFIKDTKFEDLYKIKKNLKTYHLIKAKLPPEFRDINRIKSLPDLAELVSDGSSSDTADYADIFGQTGFHLIREKKAEVKFKDDNWVVVSPLTLEASVYFGSDEWCTTKPDNWTRYTKTNKQKLYIFIDLKGKKKYQLAIPSGEFKDRLDRNISDADLRLLKPTLEKILDDTIINLIKSDIKHILGSSGIVDLATFNKFIKSAKLVSLFEANAAIAEVKSYIKAYVEKHMQNIIAVVNNKSDKEYYEIQAERAGYDEDPIPYSQLIANKIKAANSVLSLLGIEIPKNSPNDAKSSDAKKGKDRRRYDDDDMYY